MDNVDAGKALQAESISATNVVAINIITMDSRIYPLQVDTQMLVGDVKQRVSSATGVLTHHQRLIYDIRDGHTVHLVAQQPIPPSSGRIRSQPESREVLALVVSNLKKWFNETTYSADITGDVRESSRSMQAADINIQHIRGMAALARALSSWFQGVVPIDNTRNNRTGLINVPVLPDAMTTMLESVSRMRSNHQAPGASGPLAFIPPHVDPTLGALVVLLIATRRLLFTTLYDMSMLSALIRVNSSDSELRQSIQAEAHQFAAQLVDIGAFFLELGRVTGTLQMNGSRPEAVVGSGPATFITSTGPHPALTQALNRPQQPEASSGVPSSSTQPNAEDPNVGNSRRHPRDDPNPRDNKRQQRVMLRGTFP